MTTKTATGTTRVKLTKVQEWALRALNGEFKNQIGGQGMKCMTPRTNTYQALGGHGFAEWTTGYYQMWQITDAGRAWLGGK